VNKREQTFQFSLGSIFLIVLVISASLAALRIGPFVGLFSMACSTGLLVTYFSRSTFGTAPFSAWLHDWALNVTSSCLVVGFGWLVVGITIMQLFPSNRQIAFDAVRADDAVRLQSVLSAVNAQSTEMGSNIQDRLTLLHLAVVESSPEIVELLLSKGCDPNHQGAFHAETPLHRVISLRNDSNTLLIVKMLLANGADPSLENELGETPLDLASYYLPSAIPELAPEAPGIGWSRNMLYSGFNTLHRSVFLSADFNGRSDNTDVMLLLEIPKCLKHPT